MVTATVQAIVLLWADNEKYVMEATVTTSTVPYTLGQNILVVMDNSAVSLEMVRIVIRQLSELSGHSVTLLHCCPGRYWEHGGGSDPEGDIETTAVIGHSPNLALSPLAIRRLQA